MASDYPEWLGTIMHSLAIRGIAGPLSVRGCTEDEIAEVAQGRVLPRKYTDFLRVMGRGAGKLFVGTDIFYPTIINLTKYARQLVSEDPSRISLPNDAVVFATHQGYQFMFFRTDDGDDPPIYYYMELSGTFLLKFKSFTEFLVSAAAEDD